MSCHTGKGVTASGRPSSRETVSVDPRVVPLGTRLVIDEVGPRVAADTGGRSGKPNVKAMPDDAHATRSDPFQSRRGPVRPNGLMATTTWRSWAGVGASAPGATSVMTTSAAASSSA